MKFCSEGFVCVQEEDPVEVPVERCYLNRNKLSAEIIGDMDSDKRNLSRKLKQYNTQLRAYCTPELEARDELFRYAELLEINSANGESSVHDETGRNTKFSTLMHYVRMRTFRSAA